MCNSKKEYIFNLSICASMVGVNVMDIDVKLNNVMMDKLMLVDVDGNKIGELKIHSLDIDNIEEM